MELLAGCGSNREKKLWLKEESSREWNGLVTLDSNPAHKPDHVWDLNIRPLPFEENTFDECHFYDVLEHLGRQGDAPAFFEEWSEWWRILKPGGLLFGISPHYTSPWAWADPSHTRVMCGESLVFLCQAEYKKQVGDTAMSDFRYLYKADFDVLLTHVTDSKQLCFALRAIKPSRYDAT